MQSLMQGELEKDPAIHPTLWDLCEKKMNEHSFLIDK